VLVNNVYFRREEGATPELGEMLEIGVFEEERTEFFPCRLGLDVGKIALGELSSAHS
jgi:hypothetical protein